MYSVENEEKVTLKCDSCGANLQVLHGKSFMFCEHCGTKIILNNEREIVHKIVDENVIKQIEADKLLKLKEYEIYQKQMEEKKKKFYIKLSITLIGIIISIIFFCIGDMFSMFSLILLMFSVMPWLIDANKNNEEISKDTNNKTNNIKLAKELVECDNMEYESVEELYRNAGFTNIKTMAIRDLNYFSRRRDNIVSEITINGDEIEEGETYNKNAPIIIKYHKY